MMQLLMAKLGLDGELRKLLQLRLVSTKWSAMVEDYCGLKKSLIVAIKQSPTITTSPDRNDYYFLLHFKKRFFGSANVNDFTRLVLSTKIPSQYLQLLLNLFPNIQLSIYCEDNKPTRVSDFVVYLNSLESLKQLDLDGGIIKALPYLPQILSKLEQIGIADFKNILNGEDEFGQLVSHLGPDCVRIFLDGNPTIYHHIVQWHNAKPILLANLTHLHLSFNSTSEWHAKVVHYLTEHATSLNYFKARFYINRLVLTSTLIRKLANLVELDLWNIEIDISDLQLVTSSHSSSSLVTCKLVVDQVHDDNARPIDGIQLTRVLSSTFPNLANLNLNFQVYGFTQLKREIEQTLYRFPKLRKHKIVSIYDDKF